MTAEEKKTRIAALTQGAEDLLNLAHELRRAEDSEDFPEFIFYLAKHDIESLKVDAIVFGHGCQSFNAIATANLLYSLGREVSLEALETLAKVIEKQEKKQNSAN